MGGFGHGLTVQDPATGVAGLCHCVEAGYTRIGRITTGCDLINSRISGHV